MAIKVPFTSTIDRILIIPRLLSSFLIFGLVTWGIISIIEFFQLEKLKISEFLSIVIFILLLLISGIITSFIYTKTAGKFFFILSAFIYIRYKLKTKMTWKDSSSVAFLFVPNDTGKWYQLNEVLRIEENNRVSFIIEFANKVLESQSQKTRVK
jgi:hypothetical protein